MAHSARITVNRDPAAPKAEPKLGPAHDAAEAIRQQRAAIHRRAAEEISGSSINDPEPTEPLPEREDIDTIEIPLRNGLTVVYGPPRGVSLADRIARMYAGRDTSRSEFRLTRLLMGVQSIDGQPVRPLVNEIDRTALANRIGDEGIDLIAHFDQMYWPPLTVGELPTIKKNIRQP